MSACCEEERSEASRQCFGLWYGIMIRRYPKGFIRQRNRAPIHIGGRHRNRETDAFAVTPDHLVCFLTGRPDL